MEEAYQYPGIYAGYMEYDKMKKLKTYEMELVSGGTITENPDGTKTTDNIKDCGTIYGEGLFSRGDRVSCELEVVTKGTHTTKKDD